MDTTDVNKKDGFGMTQLLYAVLSNNFDNVKNLISNGADVNIPDSNNRTPLMIATANCNINIVTELLIGLFNSKLTINHKIMQIGKAMEQLKYCNDKRMHNQIMDLLIRNGDLIKNTPLTAGKRKTTRRKRLKKRKTRRSKK
jgi:ankyrin repeat protein